MSFFLRVIGSAGEGLGYHAAVRCNSVAHSGKEPSDRVELVVREGDQHVIPTATQGPKNSNASAIPASP